MKKIFVLYLSIAFIGMSLMRVYGQDTVKKPRAVKPANAYYNKSKYPYKRVVIPAGPVQAKDTSKTALQANANAPTDKSLNGQYQYLLSKVYYYQQPLVGAFHKSFMDTLMQARRDLRDVKGKFAAQSKTIDSLESSAKASDESLAASNSRVNSISMFGIDLDKTTYNLVMWGLVVVIGLIAIIVIARSGANSREAKYRTQLYNELEEEYKNYKAKANEKEKKLARELQTERNKLDELLGRG
jgi:hypothetical protein